jgi:hypothetical protein
VTRLRGRQERWLHTRISEGLEDALKREAKRRRLPVSLLVRNVLEGAFDLVEDLVEEGLHVARRSQELVRNVSRSAADEIYGWQELVLNRTGQCVRCEAPLGAGDRAFRGLRDAPGAPVFLCPTCVRRLKQPADTREEKPA